MTDRERARRFDDPYRSERNALVSAVTFGPASLDSRLRTAIVDRARGQSDDGFGPPALARFVDRVASDATSIDDEKIDALVGQGFDEEAVFEAVVAAALGASLVRLERVDELLHGVA